MSHSSCLNEWKRSYSPRSGPAKVNRSQKWKENIFIEWEKQSEEKTEVTGWPSKLSRAREDFARARQQPPAANKHAREDASPAAQIRPSGDPPTHTQQQQYNHVIDPWTCMKHSNSPSVLTNLRCLSHWLCPLDTTTGPVLRLGSRWTWSRGSPAANQRAPLPNAWL